MSEVKSHLTRKTNRHPQPNLKNGGWGGASRPPFYFEEAKKEDMLVSGFFSIVVFCA